MVMSPVGLGTKNHCAGEGQQQFSSQSVSNAIIEVQYPLYPIVAIGRSVRLMLALASTVILGFRSRRDP
jgi:hypothetical protein